MVKNHSPLNPRWKSPPWLHSGWLRGLILVWAVTLLMGIMLAGDAFFRSAYQDRVAARLSARLHLTAPAYLPAGHPERAPEGRHPGLDSRHTPRQPLSLRWQTMTTWDIRQ